MKKVDGIRSVDIKIEASGFGVVNWNGNIAVTGPDGKEINNHSIPKLRGFSNKTGKVKEGSNYEYKISADDIDLKKTPMYVSQNCIRHWLFKEESFNVTSDITSKDVDLLLCSTIGLLRGYAIAEGSPLMKKSPLLIEDFVEITGKGNFEQMGKSGSRDQQTTMYSKTTLGATKYTSFASISIEELQFISVDNIFGRSATKAPMTEVDGVKLAKKITEYLKTLDFDGTLSPDATYNECYVRQGSIMKVGEAGILLNDDAISLLVDIVVEKIKNLYIQQAKGSLSVDSVVVDYNDSKKPMRTKKDTDSALESKGGNKFAVYYAPGESEEKLKTKELAEKQKANHDKKDKKNKEVK